MLQFVVKGEVMLLICYPRGELKSVHPQRVKGIAQSQAHAQLSVFHSGLGLRLQPRLYITCSVTCRNTSHSCIESALLGGLLWMSVGCLPSFGSHERTVKMDFPTATNTLSPSPSPEAPLHCGSSSGVWKQNIFLVGIVYRFNLSTQILMSIIYPLCLRTEYL